VATLSRSIWHRLTSARGQEARTALGALQAARTAFTAEANTLEAALAHAHALVASAAAHGAAGDLDGLRAELATEQAVRMHVGWPDGASLGTHMSASMVAAAGCPHGAAAGCG
jgi:hypothetical protein